MAPLKIILFFLGIDCMLSMAVAKTTVIVTAFALAGIAVFCCIIMVCWLCKLTKKLHTVTERLSGLENSVQTHVQACPHVATDLTCNPSYATAPFPVTNHPKLSETPMWDSIDVQQRSRTVERKEEQIHQDPTRSSIVPTHRRKSIGSEEPDSYTPAHHPPCRDVRPPPACARTSRAIITQNGYSEVVQPSQDAPTGNQTLDATGLNITPMPLHRTHHPQTFPQRATTEAPLARHENTRVSSVYPSGEGLPFVDDSLDGGPATSYEPTLAALPQDMTVSVTVAQVHQPPPMSHNLPESNIYQPLLTQHQHSS